MVFIIYNEAIDEEVMELLRSSGAENYTKIKGVLGKGSTSGTHLGDDVWPGKNNFLYVACAAGVAGAIVEAVKGLRQTMGQEGVKAFVLPVEDIT